MNLITYESKKKESKKNKCPNFPEKMAMISIKLGICKNKESNFFSRSLAIKNIPEIQSEN